MCKGLFDYHVAHLPFAPFPGSILGFNPLKLGLYAMNIQLCGIFFSDYPIDRWLFCVLSTSTVMPRVQSILRNHVDRYEALKLQKWADYLLQDDCDFKKLIL